MNLYAEWAMIVVGGALVLWLASRTVRKAKELNLRIEEYRREQEAEGDPGRVVDPYAALADIHMPERKKKEGRRKRI